MCVARFKVLFGELAVSINNRANEQIRVKEVRVVSADGEQLGVIPTVVAIAKAKDAGLDLVEVAPNAEPPVCRIMDFGSFKFQKKKKEKESKKRAHVIHVKEIRLSPKIEKHDFEVKLKHARKFLEKHDRVLLSMRFRGREMMYVDRAEEVMNDFVVACSDLAKPDGELRKAGRRMEVQILPLNKK